MRFFFVKFWLETADFSDLFSESSKNKDIEERPAKSIAEYKRRFIEKNEDKEMDWISFELMNLNRECQILTYSEASSMRLKNFLYIMRSKKKNNQMIFEKMSEIKYGK